MLRNGGPMDSRQHLWLAAACFLGALLGWGAAKFRGNEEPERWSKYGPQIFGIVSICAQRAKKYHTPKIAR